MARLRKYELREKYGIKPRLSPPSSEPVAKPTFDKIDEDLDAMVKRSIEEHGA